MVPVGAVSGEQQFGVGDRLPFGENFGGKAVLFVAQAGGGFRAGGAACAGAEKRRPARVAGSRAGGGMVSIEHRSLHAPCRSACHRRTTTREPHKQASGGHMAPITHTRRKHNAHRDVDHHRSSWHTLHPAYRQQGRRAANTRLE